KTSSSEPSKWSAQRCAPLCASINWAVIRTRWPALRTEPSRKYRTPSSRPTCLLEVYGLTLVGEARISRDDEEPADPRQRGDDLLDHTVCKIFLLRVAAHIGKRQHRDRRLVRQWHCGYRCPNRLGRCCRTNAVHAQWPRDILQVLL